MSNDSAIGYALAAMKELGYTEKNMESFINEMKYQFDTKMEEAAEEYYYNQTWRNDEED